MGLYKIALATEAPSLQVLLSLGSLWVAILLQTSAHLAL